MGADRRKTRSDRWLGWGRGAAILGGWGLYPTGFMTALDLLVDEDGFALDFKEFPDIDYPAFPIGFVVCILLLGFARFAHERSWDVAAGRK